jgi:chorismate mutase
VLLRPRPNNASEQHMNSTSTTAGAVAQGRARLDDIDEALVDLIRERVAVSRQIQAARVSSGGPRVATEREREVARRWHAALGDPGLDIALRLLELSRGPL